MIYEKIGNILEQTDASYICHQVNCKGVMGAGLSLCLRRNNLDNIKQCVQSMVLAVWERYSYSRYRTKANEQL